MIIIQLVTRRQYRGAEVFAAKLCEELVHRGHKIYFVSIYQAPEKVLNAADVDNIDLSGKKIFFNPFILLRLIKLIKKINPDIIQANGSDTLKYAVLAKKIIPSFKIVYRNISMVSAWSKNNPLRKIFNRYLFHQIDAIASVGIRSMEDLITTYNIPKSKATVIRRGIIPIVAEKAYFKRKLCKEFSLDENDKIIMHIGRFSPEKNHIFILHCFLQVIIMIPDARLILVGEGENLDLIKAMVVDLKLSQHVFFTGHRSNTQELLSAADVFVLGSIVEGVPGVILEAGIQGVPSVAVSVGGVDEVVKDKQTGILILDHNIDKFSDAIVYLLNNTEYRCQLGEEARHFVIKNYSLDSSAHEFENLYNRVIGIL